MRKIDLIVIHCSATPPDMDIGVEEIRKWHKDKGFADIGYHYVIRRDGMLERGRPVEKAGAHVGGRNAHSIGVCLVGGVDEDDKPEFNFTQMQMDELYDILFDFNTKEFPDADMCGHRDLPNVNKECPCFNVRAWLGIEGA